MYVVGFMVLEATNSFGNIVIPHFRCKGNIFFIDSFNLWQLGTFVARIKIVSVNHSVPMNQSKYVISRGQNLKMCFFPQLVYFLREKCSWKLFFFPGFPMLEKLFVGYQGWSNPADFSQSALRVVSTDKSMGTKLKPDRIIHFFF